MVLQLAYIDMDSINDFQRLVEDVREHGTSIMLTRDNENIAMIKPAPKARRRRALPRKPAGRDEALLSIIGMFAAEPGEPTDVAENHDRYLAEAYLDTHA